MSDAGREPRNCNQCGGTFVPMPGLAGYGQTMCGECEGVFRRDLAKKIVEGVDAAMIEHMRQEHERIVRRYVTVPKPLFWLMTAYCLVLTGLLLWWAVR